MSTHAENVKQYEAVRERLIAEAVAARKIAPDRVPDYRRMFNASPQQITNLLTAPVEQGGLMAGIAPTEQTYPAPSADAGEYPREWVPEARPGAVRGNVAFEDQGVRAESLSAQPPRPSAPGGAPTQPAPVSDRVTVEP